MGGGLAQLRRFLRLLQAPEPSPLRPISSVLPAQSLCPSLQPEGAGEAFGRLPPLDAAGKPWTPGAEVQKAHKPNKPFGS